MYPAQPSELLRSALSLLPPLPCSVEVLSPEGGSFALTLAAVEGNLVYAYGARNLVRDDLVLEARLRDDRGEGCDDDRLLILKIRRRDPRNDLLGPPASMRRGAPPQPPRRPDLPR